MVCGVITAAVGVWFARPDYEENRIPQCDSGTFREADVQVRIDVGAAGLDYPRVTSYTRITLPRDTPGAENLLVGTDNVVGRAAVGCLLGTSRSAKEVRRSPPRIIAQDAHLVITQESYVDLAGLRRASADLARIDIGRGEQPWVLSVHSPAGLRFAQWEVAITAPEGWLSTPDPWGTAEQEPNEVRWQKGVPSRSRDGALSATVSDEVVSARLRPDLRMSVTVRTGDRAFKALVGFGLLFSELLVAFAALMYLWFSAGPFAARFESVAARRARDVALLPPVFLVLSIAAVASGNAGPDPTDADQRWRLIGSTVVVLLAVVSVVVLTANPSTRQRPFPPGAMVAPVLCVAVALTVTAVFGPDRHDVGAVALTAASTTAVAFVMTLLLVVVLGSLVLTVLRGRTNTPRWLWSAGAVASIVLVLEQLVLTHINNRHRDWLGTPAPDRDPARIIGRYAADLPYELSGLVLVIVALALCRHYADHWFEPGRDSPVLPAAVLFVFGPLWWDVHLWGIWWWAWVPGVGAIALLWFVWPRVRPPVLQHPGIDTTDLNAPHLRLQARRWHEEAGRPTRSAPTPVHVLIAHGPAESVAGNMRTAMRFVAVPAVIAGSGLLITQWVTYPLLSVDHDDSVVLDVVTTVAWEAVKWVLAAAALGLAWRHLPGKRGPVKALPLILTYCVAPIGLYLATEASDAVSDWVPLADAALFSLVITFVALRMDLAAQHGVVQPEPTGRVHRVLHGLGLTGLPSRFVESITLIAALLAIWTALNGGEVSFPSTDPTQMIRR